MKQALLGGFFLAAFAAGASAQNVELAVEVESSHAAILVRGRAEGRPVLLILDTGSGRTLLSRDLVRASTRLEPSSFNSGGPGLSVNGRRTEATIELGGRVWRNRDIVATDLAQVSAAFGRRIDGLLGQDLLREFDRVTIDFSGGRVLLEGGRR